MAKIVNGVIVRDGDGQASSDESSNGRSNQPSGTVTLFGYTIPTWTVGIALALFFLLYGIKGIFFGLLIVGVGYLMGNCSASANSAAPQVFFPHSNERVL